LENWEETKSLLQKVGSNRQLKAKTLSVEFVNPFNALALTNFSVRNTRDVSAQSLKWWWLLDIARTCFDENPGV